VTSLGDRLFVLSEEQVAVYDSTSFEFLQNIEIPRIKDYWCLNGLTSSGAENCLFVSNWNQNTIYRIDPTNDNKVSQWSVDWPRGLSMNTDSNLIVACCPQDGLFGIHKIREYRTNGKLVREIKLNLSVLRNPTHLIQLTHDQFLVSHLEPFPGVSVIDSTGEVLRSYCKYHSFDTYLRYPRQLAVAENGCVLVADQHNKRIVILNSSLSCARDLSVSVDGGL
jgi:DNA-binding beta-propeller fold protein YncE